MNLRFFIDRPVFSIVISVIIVLLGIISLTGLPVEQYPDIAPPTVQVTTSYPGANAETVQKSVIVPLEEAINGVENMSYIHSEASNTGDVTVNVYFRQGTDADMAAVNVQNRVSKAQGLLPAEVTKIGVQTQKQQKSLLKVVALYSPDDSYDMQFINNYMKINVEPRVKRIAGVHPSHPYQHPKKQYQTSAIHEMHRKAPLRFQTPECRIVDSHGTYTQKYFGGSVRSIADHRHILLF